MRAADIERLTVVAAQADTAAHGQRGRVYADAAAALGVSVATLHKRLRVIRAAPPRRPRADAGATVLTRAEAKTIAGAVEESRRLTGTGTMTLRTCVETLRDNGAILAGRVDTATGECRLLSISAIARALRGYQLHPEQLQVETPATRLKSPHPNWCWQIDASLSRQYYLAEAGAEIMDRAQYYRGKPQNFVRINANRLWRYAITDHCSGYIVVYYVVGAESATNLISALIYAMTDRGDGGMHGRPVYLMSDPGSAVTSQVTRNFCAALGIHIIVNQAGNARAKGQVEQSHNIIEREFEAAQKLVAPIKTVAECNARAAAWQHHYNATREHTRTRITRQQGWGRITPAQLVTVDPLVLRDLANSTPKTCTVRDWRIKYRGAQYDLRGLPGVLNAARVEVSSNPFAPDTVRVAVPADDGQPAWFVAPLIREDGWRFDERAATIGIEYKAVPDTAAESARREIERFVMGAATDADAAAARKAKRLAFDGTIDPSQRSASANLPPVIPRASTPSNIVAPLLVPPTQIVPTLRPQPLPEERIAPVHLAQMLKRKLAARGASWTPDLYRLVLSRWPQGVTEDQIEDCVVVLLRGSMRIAGAAL